MSPANGKPQPPLKTDLPVLAFASAAAWEDFLEREHAASKGVWLKIAKTSSGVPSVTYAEALDAALCYGWIDGQKDRWDDIWWLQRFTPRKPRSKWSEINVGKVEALAAAGRMRSAGLREVEAAKADGRWAAAYPPQSTLSVPKDLDEALQADEPARAFFDGLDRANRYAILYRLHDARTPEKRAQRLAQFVTMLRNQQRIHEPAA